MLMKIWNFIYDFFESFFQSINPQYSSDNNLNFQDLYDSDNENDVCVSDLSKSTSTSELSDDIFYFKTFKEETSEPIIEEQSSSSAVEEQPSEQVSGVFRKLPQHSVSPSEIMRKLPISGEEP